MSKVAPPTATDAHERAQGLPERNRDRQLLEAVKQGRHGVRDHLLVADDVSSRPARQRGGQLYAATTSTSIMRACGFGASSMAWPWSTPFAGDELRAIKRYMGIRVGRAPLAVHLRAGAAAHASVRELPLAAAAVRAGLPPVHPHMLRHSCGFSLANRGYDLRLIQDYLGHRDPKHTVHYTRVASRRFEGLWR